MGAVLVWRLLLLMSALLCLSPSPSPTRAAEEVPVGVVLDMRSSIGKRCQTALAMAVDDFYAAHSGYSTRMVLRTRHSGNDSVGAAAAALDLLKNEKVQAILGPQGSSNAVFVVNLGSKTHVPVVSFAAASPSLSPSHTPYFVRTSLNGVFQMGAISAIIKTFRWRKVVPLYEDTEYGKGSLPYLIDAFQEVDAEVPHRSAIPTFASDDQIAVELSKLMTMPTRVFVVHMLPPLVSRLFLKAKEMGMMSEGYVWIITEVLTGQLSTLDDQVINSMQGVVGVKAYVPETKAFSNFKERWHQRFIKEHQSSLKKNPSTFVLRAYDTAWAMAMALENAGVGYSSSQNMDIFSNVTDFSLGIFQNGPKILQSILRTKFKGVAGEFRLINGQLQPSAFQIINVIGTEGREVGFWTQTHGISQQIPNTSSFIAPNQGLKGIIWPGNLNNTPKGWEMPTGHKKLKIGLPVKGGFTEFVNTKQNVTGYCIDIFKAVIKALPYDVPYDFEPYEFAQHPGSYNDFVDQVVFKRFDAAVGDVTIIANRSLYVDFTLPFTESGVSMVVPIKGGQNNDAWIFLRPVTKGLWLAVLVFFLYTGVVIWVMEHQINNEFRGPPLQQMGTIFYFAFSTLTFAHRERIEGNLSRFVMIVWLFVVLILTSSYTASLASIMTAERLQPTVTNVNELLKNGHNVGYQDGSFVLQLLKGLKFDESKLKNYSSPNEYAEALTKGSQNGGVAAIFDEIPFIKLFLSNHCSEYMMVGPTYKTDGFGFAFPKYFPLVADISRAILEVTEGDLMQDIEKKYFKTSCPTESNSVSSNRLKINSFWRLFAISGVVSTFAALIFAIKFFRQNFEELKETISSDIPIWRKAVAVLKCYDKNNDMSPKIEKDGDVASVQETRWY